jgi:glutathione S-transferase
MLCLREILNMGANVLWNIGEGPNPWKNVILFKELGIAYNPTYLEFGAGDGGVQHEEFLKKNPAGRVPWIKDPVTG